MDNTEQTIISIATGTGQLERGLEDAGVNLRVAAYVEIEAFIIANLVAAMEKSKMGAAPIWADVKTFPAKHFHRKIHGITAGYPWQPFSKAGHRNGTKDPRHIFPDILRIIKTINPVWCFFENVSDHLTMGYDEVYKSLRNAGYKVESGIFSAEEVGAPHVRKRLFILAIKMEYANATWLQGSFFGNDTEFSYVGSSSNMEQLANPNVNDSRTVSRFIQKKTKKIENKASGKNRERMRTQFGDGGSHVSNSNCFRSGKSFEKYKSEQFIENGNQWPARQGEPQLEWEEPRTIKSGVGCSADGYDFRIDLLRALGNGVVRQTARKAFLTLLNKF